MTTRKIHCTAEKFSGSNTVWDLCLSHKECLHLLYSQSSAEFPFSLLALIELCAVAPTKGPL